MNTAQKSPRYTEKYIPVIKNFFANQPDNSSASFGGDRELGGQALSFINHELGIDDKVEVLSDVNYALININSDAFDIEEEKGKRDFLIKYLTFFLSLQNYLNYNELDENKYSRLASPPREAYEYVGHNKLNFGNKKESYALMFED